MGQYNRFAMCWQAAMGQHSRFAMCWQGAMGKHNRCAMCWQCAMGQHNRFAMCWQCAMGQPHAVLPLYQHGLVGRTRHPRWQGAPPPASHKRPATSGQRTVTIYQPGNAKVQGQPQAVSGQPQFGRCQLETYGQRCICPQMALMMYCAHLYVLAVVALA